jgi:cytochrome c553
MDRKNETQGAKGHMMKVVGLAIAVLVIVASAPPVFADDTESVRNCTWCHGQSGQGYAAAPRLAGQRARYIESQLQSFSRHTRDNPFSKQYMWGATAALNPRTGRYLARHFSKLPAEAADDGERARSHRKNDLPRRNSGFQHCVLRRLSRPEGRGRQGHSSSGRALLLLLETKTQAMARRISCGRRLSHASHCKHIAAECDRRARVIPQFRQMTRYFLRPVVASELGS